MQYSMCMFYRSPANSSGSLRCYKIHFIPGYLLITLLYVALSCCIFPGAEAISTPDAAPTAVSPKALWWLGAEQN